MAGEGRGQDTSESYGDTTAKIHSTMIYRSIGMTRDDRERLYSWLDTYGQRHCSFGEDQERRLDEFRRRMAKMLAR